MLSIQHLLIIENRFKPKVHWQIPHILLVPGIYTFLMSQHQCRLNIQLTINRGREVNNYKKCVLISRWITMNTNLFGEQSMDYGWGTSIKHPAYNIWDFQIPGKREGNKLSAQCKQSSYNILMARGHQRFVCGVPHFVNLLVKISDTN